MLSGTGRHRLSGNGFSRRPNLGEPDSPRHVAAQSQYQEKAYGPGDTYSQGNSNVPDGTMLRSFAKPTAVGLNIGLISSDPRQQVLLAREMFENDPICGAVVETICGIPFGAFSLSGLPNRETSKPYETSLDRIRSKSLMPVLAKSNLVDGAFIGGGMFDDNDRAWNAIIPYDFLHANIVPVPFFGATPIIDIQLQQDAMKAIRSGDERMNRYRKFLPEKYFSGGVIKLAPESTFYIPNSGLSHQPLGISLYRKVMIVYLLEKALARGTIEMAYRRQRPITFVQAGDENWDASIAEMQYLSDLIMSADLDPLGAVIVTRPGINVQEIGEMGTLWRWTDNIDVLTSLKLKGLGMPDGLLGGDMALDSVSATLTVFINQMRQYRERITRLFYYEKFFPYIAITNEHRKDGFAGYAEESSCKGLLAISSDTEVDLEDYFTPTISWHVSLRPEGDKDYLDLLEQLRQMGVPIPIRILTAAGGLDIHDILNSAPDDIKIRSNIANINAQIAQMDQQGGMGQQDQQGGGMGGGFASDELYNTLDPIKKKGIANREYGDQFDPRTSINGHRYVTTAREKRRREEKNNRVIAKAAAELSKKLNKNPNFRKQVVKYQSHTLLQK